MRSREQQALLDVIRHFKPEGVSDLDAALNAIAHKAETEKQLLKEVERLEDRLESIRKLTQPPASEPDTKESP